MLDRLLRRLGLRPPASADYRVIDRAAARRLGGGWQSAGVARRQRAAFAPLLRQLRAGQARADFRALAAAVQATGLVDPFLVEVGCGNGWNGEVLARLRDRRVRYLGLDYSPAMVALARQDYPQAAFAVGDATALPLRDAACDVLLSGTVLMHVLDYAAAVRESRRVTRRWCVFHTVPLLQRRATTFLSKRAYGAPTVEIVFNETELLALFRQCRLVVREVFPGLQYDLAAVLQEPTVVKTFLCEAADA